MFGGQNTGLFDGYQKLWKAIIRPPRAEYTLQHLGPKVFDRKNLRIQRTDVQIINKQGKKLQCSHYQPFIRPARQLPCVIYLHGNSSCRIQGQRNVHYLISRDITVFTFDFAGCGLSQGQYISLGFYQRGDVDCVFKYLRGLGNVSSIGIWGRSMGAVTALMYADENHEIGCLVCDSPFSNLQRLCKQLAEKYGGGLSFFSGIALSFIKSTIKDKNNFNIQDLDPIGKHVKNAYISAFFIHGEDDNFIVPKHSQDLYQAYSGDKKIKIVPGDHNTDRPKQILEEVATFFYYGLSVGQLVKVDKLYIQQQKKQKQPSQQKQQKDKQDRHKILQQLPVFSFGLQDEQQQLRQAIALSLIEINPKVDKKQENKQDSSKLK